MDVAFEVYLPIDANWSAFPFQTPVFTWEGVQYPQGEPEWAFGPNFKLIKQLPEQPDELFRLPLSHRTFIWQPISISGPGLDIHRSALEGNVEEDANGSLEKLLQHLLADQNHWVIVYMPGYDPIDEVISGNITTVLEKIKYSMQVETKGFVIWGGKEEIG